MKFGILSQWFDPEPVGGAISGSLARELARRGHKVKVLTGFPNYPEGRIYPGFSMRPYEDCRKGGVSIRRVALYPSHDNLKAHRLGNYGSFALSAALLGTSWLRNVDAIWVYNSPASIALPAWSTKLLARVPHVLHIMDLWPDSIIMSGFGGEIVASRPGTRLLHAWCSATYRSASSIAYVAPSVGKVLVERGVAPSKLHHVPVWADEIVAAPSIPLPRSDLGADSEDFLVLYAGALGESQGVDALLCALALIRDQVRVTCLIAGTGTAAHSLQMLAENLGLSNVRFLGQVPRGELTSIANTADLHVVMLGDSPIASITMPSKIQTTLACSKPFIAAVPGDARAAAALSGAAFLARPGDPVSIAEALRQAHLTSRAKLREMGQQGADYYERTYSLQSGVDKLEKLLISAALREV